MLKKIYRYFRSSTDRLRCRAKKKVRLKARVYYSVDLYRRQLCLPSNDDPIYSRTSVNFLI